VAGWLALLLHWERLEDRDRRAGGILQNAERRPTFGMSSGPAQIVPPSFLARASVASASSTAT